MSSKILLFVLPFGLLLGCSLKLNDPVNRKIQLVNTGSGCLAQAGDVLQRFSSGQLSEADHDGFYNCLDRALNTFALHADGKQRDYFEPEELGNFLTTYFLKGKNIPPALLREATVLKQALIGGASDKITREEFRRIIALFAVLKTSTRMLRPVMPIRVSSYIDRGYSSAQFEDAIARFTRAVAVVGDNIKTEQGPYSFDHFAALVKEIRAFLYQKNDSMPENHWTTTLLKASEVIRPAKVIFISQPRDEIAPADWPKVYRLAPRYFASYLRAQFYLNSVLSSFSIAGLARIEHSFADFVNIFEFVLEQHDGNVISAAEIDDFLGTLFSQDMLPCNPGTARAFLKVMFGRVLSGSKNTEQTSDLTINKESLNRLKETVRFSLEGFHAIAALYKHELDSEPKGLTREKVESASSEELLHATQQRSKLSLEAVEAVKRTPREVRTIFSGNSFVVRIPRKKEPPPAITHFHLAKVHGLRALNRLIMQSYATPGATELKEKELNAFLDDIFPLLIELKLATKETRISIGKRLEEASLFLYSSDGKKGLTMPEAIELEALVLSTLSHAPRVHAAIADRCEAPVRREAPRAVKSRCYEQQFLSNGAKIWGYIPGLADFFANRPDRERHELFQSMARFLRKGRSESEDFLPADTLAFTLLPYYIELLFSRFDRNGDGLLTNEEADAAYPVFQPLLVKKASQRGITDPQTHKAIFNFLLAFRELPDDDMTTFVLRRYLLGAKQFKVDRGQVVEIFAKLMSL